MCRPTKRPKPLAVVQPHVEVEQRESEANTAICLGAKEEADQQFMTLAYFLDGPQDDLFLVPDSSDSGSSSPESSSSQSDARPKTFVYTTFDMVSNVENAQALGFTADGTALEIRDIEFLTEKILPKYFRHKNVTSFYRQLNSYGFRTTRSTSANIAHTFAHDMFKRGHSELLGAIVRKKCNPRAEKAGTKKEEIVFDMPPVASTEELVELASTQVSSAELPSTKPIIAPSEAVFGERQLHEKAETLETLNRVLSAENKSLIRESENIFRVMHELVENQTVAIAKLFGAEAAAAFAEQAKPFRFDLTPEVKQEKTSVHDILKPQVTAQAQDFNDFIDESNEIMFQDDELEMLENIFTMDSSALVL